jgi:single-stranded-DNA-specific exonuclease
MVKFLVRQNPPQEFSDNFPELSDFLKRHLFHINIKEPDIIESFISPDFDKHTHDPFLLKDIFKSIERIFQAIKQNQKICIYSDYDADGIPGAVILHDFFKKIDYHNFINYIPHRNKEGFGINNFAIDYLIEQKIDLIISIDCGIADVEPINRAGMAGIDVIITDHHEVPDILPSAFAIINPKQKDCLYPEKMLCGAGVVFKLIQALIKQGRIENFSKINEIKEGWEKWLLDMVGIATLSDMVPLVGENRVFAKYGLIVLRKTARIGLLKLFKEARINQKNLNEDDIGFSITPKINASSRMGEPEIAFKLLSTSDPIEADLAVKHLTHINNERRGVVASISKDIHKILDKHFETQNNTKIIVRGNPNWSPSLLGLVANNLVEKYNLPAFLWGKGEGNEYKGSCRSNGAVNVVDVMKEISSDIVTHFGGHEMAGGFVISDSGIFDFENILERAFEKVNQKNIAEKILIVDSVLKIDDFDSAFLKKLSELAPFGMANEKPIFLVQDAQYVRTETFGKAKEHLKIIFKKLNGQEIPAIKFFDNGKIAEKIANSKTITLAVIPEESFFMNKREFRMRIVEVL